MESAADKGFEPVLSSGTVSTAALSQSIADFQAVRTPEKLQHGQAKS
jgi:hypothetical protein